MKDTNRVEIEGTLGRDVEVKTFSSGARAANLSVATSNHGSGHRRATGMRRRNGIA